MFNIFIRRSKGSHGWSRQGEDDALAAGAMPMATATRFSGNDIAVSSCNRCSIDHLAKDCPAKQVAVNQLLPVANGFETLPYLRDAPSPQRYLLFRKKLALCSIIYDFTDPSKSVKEKEVKTQTLIELVDYVTTVGTAKLNETLLEEAFRMMSVNLFRSLPLSSYDPLPGGDAFDADKEEPMLDPSWSHIRLAYDLLLHYLVHQETEAKVAKRYINQSFVLRLLDLFDSEDPRERDYLKTLLHRIYGKLVVLRPFIRKAINDIFYRFMFETEQHSGIREILEILGSIINGFALPLKEEHKLFLDRVLIPLHKPKCLGMYHEQLTYCITLFVEKDCKLADTVIRGILKYWPLTNSHKEVIMLGAVEEVLKLTQPLEFQCCMVPLFRQVSRSLDSLHFQVAERASMVWDCDHIASLIARNRSVILPLIFGALEKSSSSHWNQAVHGLMRNVRKMFQELDAELFQECLNEYRDKESKAKVFEEQRDAVWKRLEAAAAGNVQSVNMILVT